MKEKWTEPPGNGGKKRKHRNSDKYLEIQILGFRKTRHFASRQRVRKIEDSLLARILWTINPTVSPTAVVITRNEIKKMAFTGKIEEQYRLFSSDLVLVIHGWVLITCFTTEVNSYITSSSIQDITFFFSNP
jgi:hypothetical protein